MGSDQGGGKFALIGLIIGAVILIYFSFMSFRGTNEISYNEFLGYVNNENGRLLTDIRAPLIINEDGKITGRVLRHDGEKPEIFTTRIPPIWDGGDLYKKLQDNNIIYKSEESQNSMITMILVNVLPIILMVMLLIFMTRQMQGGAGGTMNFGRSRARKYDSKDKVTFDDVAGVNEAKTELQEVIEFLKDKERFTRIGAKIPKGVLLVGPPGTGKTLLARAVAGESGVPFFYTSGSDFLEMFVGVGASRVRDLFETGRKNAPCILFIDELDAVGRTRGAGYGGGHDEREQTLNQLLVEMDGFDPSTGVILIAATNRPDVLDQALLRPGRFDRQVVVDNPDMAGREAIFGIHLKKIKTSKNVSVSKLARATPGFSGADIANMVNEAALFAARQNKKKVTNADLEEARDKITMGIARRSRIIPEKDKRLTAYHEAGHTIVNMNVENSDPLHKVSIVPRGMALGITSMLPQEDEYHLSKSRILDQICVFMGGRVAEELTFGAAEICTGASNDIQRATEMARKMVTEWGMTDTLGPIAYGQKEEPIFIGKEIAHHKDYSEETAQTIDEEVKKIVTAQYDRARSILTENADKLKKLAEELTLKETMDAEEVYVLLGVEPQQDLANFRIADEAQNVSGDSDDDSEDEVKTDKV
ncbi:MAG: ATP-dependent zinc metalloprotease FtsH [Spirochaetales bacterium]|nr:ATP-dependent zinc metalloprotease FtsH [Spirochaetales bacterium]